MTILELGAIGEQTQIWRHMQAIFMGYQGFFNQDFLEEVESLREGATRYRQQLDERGLQL